MSKVNVDKNTWYEDRSMYAGLYEVKVHLLDSKGIQQDIITCFPTKSNKNTILARLDEIRTKCNTIDTIIKDTTPSIPFIISSEVDKYTPEKIYNMMAGKKVDTTTTWNDVISGKLVTVVVK